MIEERHARPPITTTTVSAFGLPARQTWSRKDTRPQQQQRRKPHSVSVRVTGKSSPPTGKYLSTAFGICRKRTKRTTPGQRSNWWKSGNLAQTQVYRSAGLNHWVQSFFHISSPVAQVTPATAYIPPRPVYLYSSKDKPSPLLLFSESETARVVGVLLTLPCSQLCLNQARHTLPCSPNN